MCVHAQQPILWNKTDLVLLQCRAGKMTCNLWQYWLAVDSLCDIFAHSSQKADGSLELSQAAWSLSHTVEKTRSMSGLSLEMQDALWDHVQSMQDGLSRFSFDRKFPPSCLLDGSIAKLKYTSFVSRAAVLNGAHMATARIITRGFIASDRLQVASLVA